jgi:hypothetical protein
MNHFKLYGEASKTGEKDLKKFKLIVNQRRTFFMVSNPDWKLFPVFSFLKNRDSREIYPKNLRVITRNSA